MILKFNANIIYDTEKRTLVSDNITINNISRGAIMQDNILIPNNYTIGYSNRPKNYYALSINGSKITIGELKIYFTDFSFGELEDIILRHCHFDYTINGFDYLLKFDGFSDQWFIKRFDRENNMTLSYSYGSELPTKEEIEGFDYV